MLSTVDSNRTHSLGIGCNVLQIAIELVIRSLMSSNVNSSRTLIRGSMLSTADSNRTLVIRH